MYVCVCSRCWALRQSCEMQLGGLQRRVLQCQLYAVLVRPSQNSHAVAVDVIMMESAIPYCAALQPHYNGSNPGTSLAQPSATSGTYKQGACLQHFKRLLVDSGCSPRHQLPVVIAQHFKQECCVCLGCADLVIWCELCGDLDSAGLCREAVAVATLGGPQIDAYEAHHVCCSCSATVVLRTQQSRQGTLVDTKYSR